MDIRGVHISGAKINGLNALYAFTNFLFTTAGITGPTGPTLGNVYTSYSNVGNTWLQNTSFFNVTTPGYQQWTVPASGTYKITAAGARGGINLYAASTYGNTWGNGAVISGSFYLQQGANVTVLVGQIPQPTATAGSYNGAGGGGGSFVVLNQSTPLIVAGGGGGTGAYASPPTPWPHQANGVNGTTNINGTNSVNGAPGGVAGTGGNSHVNGNAVVSSNPYDGGAGGGFLSNGAGGVGGNIRTNTQQTSAGAGGQGYQSGAIGGYPASSYLTSESYGGFGGGGGGGPIAGGGAGGYSGGGGGWANTSPVSDGGGGGGSFIANTVISSVATSDGNYNGSNVYNAISITNLAAWNSNSGYVQITRIS